uniref:Uncharacterized protein n=1 Tax=Callorhinchus milii TaxID=7868 RepID=A0A4W3GK55_CALMI
MYRVSPEAVYTQTLLRLCTWALHVVYTLFSWPVCGLDVFCTLHVVCAWKDRWGSNQTSRLRTGSVSLRGSPGRLRSLDPQERRQ